MTVAKTGLILVKVRSFLTAQIMKITLFVGYILLIFFWCTSIYSCIEFKETKNEYKETQLIYQLIQLIDSFSWKC